jgi:hypothetical protein
MECRNHEYKVNTNEKTVPPTITTLIPILLVEAAPVTMQYKAPNAIARLVINRVSNA